MDLKHKDLAEGKWDKLSLSLQMANIGSEVSRALNWMKKGNKEYSLNSVNRAIELIYLTLGAINIKSHLKEVARLKEVIADYFYGSNSFLSSEKLFRSYFDHFAYAARRNFNRG